MRVVFAVNGDPSKPITQAASLASARYRGLIPAGEMARRQIRSEVFTVFDLLRPNRSEEHTSELQSLMRISYAVFCLKKKKKNNTKKQQLEKKQPITLHN